MKPRHRAREVVNWLTLSTPLGLLIAGAGRARLYRVGGGMYLADKCALMLPDAGAFTVGNVVIANDFATLRRSYPQVLDHEAAHASQWALLGPLFLPVYLAWTAWSLWRTGDRWSRNYLERWAGLARGGYVESPIRRPPVS